VTVAQTDTPVQAARNEPPTAESAAVARAARTRDVQAAVKILLANGSADRKSALGISNQDYPTAQDEAVQYIGRVHAALEAHVDVLARVVELVQSSPFMDLEGRLKSYLRRIGVMP
jgi:hypothetical protein